MQRRTERLQHIEQRREETLAAETTSYNLSSETVDSGSVWLFRTYSSTCMLCQIGTILKWVLCLYMFVKSELRPRNNVR